MPNYQIKCPYHNNCYKSRGDIPAWKRNFGPIEIIACLQAWVEVPWPTEGGKGTHRGEFPKDNAVREVAEANVAELEAIIRRLRS